MIKRNSKNYERMLVLFFSAINKYSYFYLRDEVEVRRGPGGEAGGLEADDPQLHGEVRHGQEALNTVKDVSDPPPSRGIAVMDVHIL